MSSVPALFLLAAWLLGLVSSQVQVLPSDIVYAMYELTNEKVIISKIDCVDSSRSSNPIFIASGTIELGNCLNCFQVYPRGNCNGMNTDFCLTFYPKKLLDYEESPVYKISVDCREVGNITNVDTKTVEIRLYPNTPPSFNTLSTVTHSLANTESVSAGASVYAVRCSDDDGDALDFALTTPSDLFYIDAKGVIRASRDLTVACFSTISFEVTCSDRINDPINPVYIDVTLNGANQQPAITGLNFNLDIPEDRSEGSTLASYTVDDDDTTNCLITTNPLSSLQYFELDTASKAVKVKRGLDYEQVATRNTNITVTCTDGFCSSVANYLYVRVTEVNEPIILVPSDFILSTYEGRIVLDPEWTPIDPDIGDYPTYTIIGGNNNGYFTINPLSGIITSTIEYDVDLNPLLATDFLIVQAKDIAGHVSTATVSLTILDVNDNPPTFIVGAQTIVVPNCPGIVGTAIGTAILATDLDSSLDGNNVISYDVTGGPVTVDTSGNIIVTSPLTTDLSYTLQVVASDSGIGPKRALSSLPVTVTVIVTECVVTTLTPPITAAPPTAGPTQAPTTAAETTAKNTKDTLDENLAWIIFAGLFATVFLAALIFMIWRFCYPAGPFSGGGRFMAFCNNACGDCCTPRPAPRTVQPVRGQPPTNGTGAFWQERYTDDDYNKPPIRDRTPSPAPIEGDRPLALEPATNWRPRQYPEYF